MTQTNPPSPQTLNPFPKSLNPHAAPKLPQGKFRNGPSMTPYTSRSFCIPRTCLNPNIIAPTPYYAGPWRSSLNILFTNPCAGRSCCATKEPERGPNYHVKQNFFQLAHYKLLPKTKAAQIPKTLLLVPTEAHKHQTFPQQSLRLHPKQLETQLLLESRPKNIDQTK